MARWEKTMERLDRQEAKLHDQMAAAAADHVKLRELDEQARALADERAAAEEQWLAAAEIAG